MNDKKFIYVLCDELGRFKLGITNNFSRRIKQIENATGLIIKKSYCEETTQAYNLEQKLLEYFQNYRLNGTEWIVSGMSFFSLIDIVHSYIEKGKEE